MCPSTKKEYFNREDAEKFAAKLKRDYPNEAEQYAYACEDCNHYHLSTIPPESRSLAKVAYPAVPEPSLSPLQERYRKTTKEDIDQMCVLYRQGKDYSQISRILNATPATVRYWLVKSDQVPGLTVVDGRVVEIATITKTSMEKIEDEEAKILARLEELKKRREEIFEAKRLKVEPNQTGFVFRKEGNVLSLSFEDVTSLIKQVFPMLPNRSEVADELDRQCGPQSEQVEEHA
jgi:hypothetical protein